jgi:hypothetical protein
MPRSYCNFRSYARELNLLINCVTVMPYVVFSQALITQVSWRRPGKEEELGKEEGKETGDPLVLSSINEEKDVSGTS